MVLVELWHSVVQSDIPVPACPFREEMESDPGPELQAVRMIEQIGITIMGNNDFIS